MSSSKEESSFCTDEDLNSENEGSATQRDDALVDSSGASNSKLEEEQKPQEKRRGFEFKVFDIDK